MKHIVFFNRQKKAALIFTALLLSLALLLPTVEAFAAPLPPDSYAAESAADEEVSNADIIYNFLTDELGLNSAAACGILANMQAESGLEPTAGTYGSCYGLCQWCGSRCTGLNEFCAENGWDENTLLGQLCWLQYELTENYGSIYDYMLSVPDTASGAYDAGWYWCYYFEAPAARDSSSATRGSAAQCEWWPLYGA